MSSEQIRELWSRFLAGEEISAGDQKALVEALDADPELRESLLENLQLDGMLQAMNTTRRQGEGFVRNLTECLDVEHDGTRFVQKVELRLNEAPPPPPSGGKAGRGTKPPTARLFRRRSASSATGETAWKPALIAASVFAAIFLLVLASTKPTPSRPVLPSPREEVVRIPPPEVTPTIRPEPLPRPETPRKPEAPTPPLTPRQFPEQKPEERPTPPPSEEKRPPAEGQKPAPSKETVPSKAEAAVTMRVERTENNVYIVKGLSKDRPRKGESVPFGCEVETVGASSAGLVFEDKTWVDLGASSSFREVRLAPNGRQVALSAGTLLSHIEKQPADRPMAFLTPNAEATVLGTTLRLTYSNNPRMTTLEVKEGTVRLTRLSDRQSVVVTTGQFAVVADDGDLRVHRNVPDTLTIRFGPAGIVADATLWVDSGDEFDAARGYGWLKAKDEPVPGITWRNPATGFVESRPFRRMAVRRTTDPKVDPLKSTDVVAGWAGHTETWSMPVPNGQYQISICCGDATWEQGPHHVSIEGFQIINEVKNRKGEFVERTGLFDVKDGELTMIVGGNKTARKSSDGSTDTLINYLILKRVDPRKK
jgi:hypothetical protein